MSSETLVTHLEAYLDYRIQNGIGTTVNLAEFRGLNPDLPLIREAGRAKRWSRAENRNA